MTHREIIARALAEFRFDLDEGGRPIIGPITIERMADAILADLDKRGLCIVPKPHPDCDASCMYICQGEVDELRELRDRVRTLEDMISAAPK